MNIAMLLALLSSLVPNLVSVFTKNNPSAPAADARQWVTDGVNSVLTKVESLEPSWAQTLTEDGKPFIDIAINYELNRLGMK